MDKKEILEHLELYRSVLSSIDKKAALLEYSDREAIKLKKQLRSIQTKFSGVNFIIKWIIFMAISLVPMSLLNYVIQVDFNLVILSPIISLLILFLYKIKYSQNTQKTLINSTKDALFKVEKENKELIGGINYSKKMADNLLELLLIYVPKENEPKNLSITDCKEVYVNTTALLYSYVYIEEHLSASFNDAIEHFEALIEDLEKKVKEEESEKNQERKKLLEEYKTESLKSQLRKGIILRCEKCQETEEKAVDKPTTKK